MKYSPIDSCRYNSNLAQSALTINTSTFEHCRSTSLITQRLEEAQRKLQHITNQKHHQNTHHSHSNQFKRQHKQQPTLEDSINTYLYTYDKLHQQLQNKKQQILSLEESKNILEAKYIQTQRNLLNQQNNLIKQINQLHMDIQRTTLQNQQLLHDYHLYREQNQKQVHQLKEIINQQSTQINQIKSNINFHHNTTKYIDWATQVLINLAHEIQVWSEILNRSVIYELPTTVLMIKEELNFKKESLSKDRQQAEKIRKILNIVEKNKDYNEFSNKNNKKDFVFYEEKQNFTVKTSHQFEKILLEKSNYIMDNQSSIDQIFRILLTQSSYIQCLNKENHHYQDNKINQM